MNNEYLKLKNEKLIMPQICDKIFKVILYERKYPD